MSRLALLLGCILISIPLITATASTGTDRIARQLSRPLAAKPEKQAYSIHEIINHTGIRRLAPAVDFNTIRFGFRSDRISRRQSRSLNRIATALKKLIARNPHEVFLIEGHTDATGPRRYNRQLSTRRALAVLNNLVTAHGIPHTNLVAVGYGERFLKVRTKRRNRQNRRVIFRRITALLSSVVLAPARKPAPATPKPAAKAVPAPAAAIQPKPFVPTLQKRQTLPFTPPEAKPPFTKPAAKPKTAPKPAIKAVPAPAAAKQPKPFVPTLQKRRILPFTPPEAKPPFVKPAVKPKTAPTPTAKAAPTPAPSVEKPKPFVPTLQKRRTLPFTPPEAKPPSFPTKGE
jgi:outer membrane protein OmpA-like peptidoglycan-associated protein